MQQFYASVVRSITWNMSNPLKALIWSAYGTLLIFYLIKMLSSNTNEIELDYVVRPKGTLLNILQYIRKNNDTGLHFVYSKPDRMPTDLKYILKWTRAFKHYNMPNVKDGQSSFIENNCAHFNCYLSSHKSLLVDPSNFDAIIFDAENVWDTMPVIRASHQKYILAASESSDHYPNCDPFFDDFYNFTWTYKLDSDIRWSYFAIEDKHNNFVGPKVDMKWIQPMKPTPKNFFNKLVIKRKAAAWFVSNCKTSSGRENVAKEIMQELAKFNLVVETYGWCGKQTCPKDRMDECLELLEQDYYFYFAFENSLSEDYVTEKLLHPLNHMTVPVVFGGANYSRFLPPGSYINAGTLKPAEVATQMNDAIKNPERYREYFRWHNHYVYKNTPTVADVCKLCEILNDPSKTYTVVKNFRKWWNPDYEKKCRTRKVLQNKDD